MKKLIIGAICIALLFLTGTAHAIDDDKVLAIEDKALSANAKADGNNSRIQGLESDIADLQNQIDAFDVAELVIELCNLYALTEKPPPLLCHNCGNGYQEHLEECEDGNLVDGDGCNADCLVEECGNGRIDYNEDCDDGNVISGDGCNDLCAFEYRKVFITSQGYTGDMDDPQGGFGGLEGADNICNQHATQAGLSGNFKAWLSNNNESPSNRFTHSNGAYILVAHGIIIANNWDDLTDGNLRNSISVDEYGVTHKFYDVWTNTLPNGERKSPDNHANCYEWTEWEFILGGKGFSAYTSNQWTDDGTDYCNNYKRLYCFEQ